MNGRLKVKRSMSRQPVLCLFLALRLPQLEAAASTKQRAAKLERAACARRSGNARAARSQLIQLMMISFMILWKRQREEEKQCDERLLHCLLVAASCLLCGCADKQASDCLRASALLKPAADRRWPEFAFQRTPKWKDKLTLPPERAGSQPARANGAATTMRMTNGPPSSSAAAAAAIDFI